MSLTIAGLAVLALLPLCTILPGVRMVRAVPRAWTRVRGQWLGPQLQFSASRYAYTHDGRVREGSTRLRFWRLPLCDMTVAVDPTDPTRSVPAATRTGGVVLIVFGILCMVATTVLLFVLA